MRKRILCIIFAIALLVMFIKDGFVFAESINKTTDDTVKLLAEAGVLMDGESGRILYGKNADQELPMASTTKIMTCIVALENADLTDKVEISKYASEMPEVRLGVRKEEWYYLKDLLYSLMLESHNDSAVAIAEHVGKTTDNFARMMNQKAKEIGCKNTYFITPNGLDARNEKGTHSTTAKDLAAILRYCIMLSPKHEEFIQICQTREYTFTSIPGSVKKEKRKYSLRNHNALLEMYAGAVAGKTGFTGKAGYCYVGAVKQNGKLLIVSLLACGWPSHKNYKWIDTRNLLNYGKKYFVIHVDQMVPEIKGQIEIKGSLSQWKGEKHILKTVIRSPSEKGVKMLKKQSEKLEIIVEQPKMITAPVKKGDTVGNIKAVLDQQIIFEWKILSDETIEKLCFKDVFELLLRKTNLKNVGLSNMCYTDAK